MFVPKDFPYDSISPFADKFNETHTEMTENKNTENITFTPQEFADVSKYLMGSSVKLYPTIHVPQVAGPARIQSQPELQMQRVAESCPFKSMMSFVIGGAMGAFMGLFSSSIAPHHTVQVTMSDITSSLQTTS